MTTQQQDSIGNQHNNHITTIYQLSTKDKRSFAYDKASKSETQATKAKTEQHWQQGPPQPAIGVVASD